MNVSELSERAIQIKDIYAELQKKERRPDLYSEDFALGFVKDVGDLMKLVMAKNGKRQVKDLDVKLGHELSDCLWSILVLADLFSVDLESPFIKTMDELDEKISKSIKNEYIK